MIKIELQQDTYKGNTIVKKFAKISTTHFNAGEEFTFTPVKVVWSGQSKFAKKNGEYGESHLCEIKYNNDVVFTWQNDDSAFYKIFKSNLGKEICIKKIMKETSKGNPYYTFEVVGGNSTPSISLGNVEIDIKEVNYEENGVKFTELDVINAVRSANEGDNPQAFKGTLMKYGVPEVRANFLFENRYRIK